MSARQGDARAHRGYARRASVSSGKRGAKALCRGPQYRQELL